MSQLVQISGRELLDSRGRPTVAATCRLENGASGTASVPSGASTGAAEAVELRDGDQRRYRGLGCRRAVAAINGDLREALCGRSWGQTELDQTMVQLDGTGNKSKLGANAILAVSIAHARARAAELEVPLYQHFADILGQPLIGLPALTINLFSGGKHAGKQVAIQDVLIVPLSHQSIDQALSMTYEIYQCAAERIQERYGMRLLTADEGGLAPPFESADEMLAGAVEAIERSGYTPGKDVGLAIDVAASHFFQDDVYQLDGKSLNSHEMIDVLAGWQERYPLLSIEDGLQEDDWAGWPVLQERLGSQCLIVGDDFLCTNPERMRRAVEAQACNALLLKVNQIGTLTEAADACRLARSAGWQVTISVRSGETEDDWAADLAVGWGGDQFKNGSITQSERLAKYNRLLVIEAESSLPVKRWQASR